MTGNFTKLCVLMVLAVLLISTAVLAGDYKSQLPDPRASRELANDRYVPWDNAKGNTQSSLGVYASDGGSPGYIIGRSWRDDQAHYAPGRMVDWRVDSRIHFIFTGQACQGHTNPESCARWYQYNNYNPATGTFVNGASGVMVQSNPLDHGGLYTQLDVDEFGNAILTGETFESALAADALRRVETYYDIGAATFTSDTLPGEILDLDANFKYPRVAYQEYGGQYITHIMELEGTSVDTFNVTSTYWRQVNTASGPGGSWTSTTIEDYNNSNSFDIAAARDGSGEFAIVWLVDHDSTHIDATGADLWVLRSHDAGASFDPRFNIVPFDPDADSWQPWIDVNALIDSEGYLHVAWTTSQYDGETHDGGSIDPARIFHWSDRAGGPNNGGTTSTVHIADFDLNQMCGRGRWNCLNVAKAVVSECNGRLYTVWQQYGDPEVGDTADCVDPSILPFNGGYNADIFMSVSSTLDGLLWDAARNLTNSKSPDCDTTDGGDCDHDCYATMSRHGMNTADFAPTIWSSVKDDGSMGRLNAFAVRDEIAPGYSDDGYYLDLQFVNDLLPDIARAPEIGWWANSPIKWFRLPCVPPVIKPRILISEDPYTHPVYWAKSGEETTFDVLVENIGNAELQITGITPTYIQGGSGWLNISPSAVNIPAASTDLISFTINPGGAINPPAGTAVAIEAAVVFANNDIDRPAVEYEINTIIADSVVVPAWDTISTGLGMALTVANQGGVGNVGVGEANLDFVGPDIDCDIAQTVYLFDACPVMMTDATTYSWGPFWAPNSTLPQNFQPVADGISSKIGMGSGFEQYCSGTFVSHDSTLGFTTYWVAPEEDVSWMIQRMDVYSYDGGTYSPWLGQWLDWDIPSDTGSNNEGSFVAAPGGVDYLYQTGLEYDEDDDECLDANRRFGGSGLLGWYWQSEYDADDAVNHTGLYGGKVCLDADLFPDNASNNYLVDSMWALLNTNALSANNTDQDDQQIVLSFGNFTVAPGDTLQIWTVHFSAYDAELTDVQAMVDSAAIWYMAKRADIGKFGCCGAFTGGYTGNANCDIEGKRNLADISKLIDRVYLSKAALCCEENGNVNGDVEAKINLADISKLIDHVYLSKAETAACP